MTSVCLLLDDGGYSNITRRFRLILLDWWLKVRDRFMVWSREVVENQPGGAKGEYYLPHFHCFALEGVVNALEVLANHWDKEISWESWTGPTPLV